MANSRLLNDLPDFLAPMARINIDSFKNSFRTSSRILIFNMCISKPYNFCCSIRDIQSRGNRCCLKYSCNAASQEYLNDMTQKVTTIKPRILLIWCQGGVPTGIRHKEMIAMHVVRSIVIFGVVIDL